MVILSINGEILGTFIKIKMMMIRFFLLFFTCWLGFSITAVALNLKIEVRGLKDQSLKNVNARLAIEEAAFAKPFNEESIIKFYNRIPGIIQKALQPFGYFHVKVHANLISVGNQRIALFKVDTGPPLRIGQIDFQIEGNANKVIKDKLAKAFSLKEGDVFLATEYEKAKQQLFDEAHDAGFIKFVLTENRIMIDKSKNRAKIILHFNIGEKYFFGRIIFDKTPYSEKFMKKFINFKENEAFSSEKIVTLQQEMSNSYFFNQVMLSPDFNSIQNNRIPIYVSVTVPKSKKYSIGLGYGTSTGARLTAGSILRRLGTQGEHLNMQLKLSSILAGVGGQYYIPGKNPITDQWIIGANYQYFNPKNGISHSFNISGGYLYKKNKWQVSSNLNFLLDYYEIDNIEHSKKRFGKLFYPNVNLSYIDADDLINTHSGKSFNFSLQGASRALLSSTDFIQTELKAKYLFSPFSFNRIILRGNIGYTITHNINELPLSMQFFAGGLNSVRGYPESSLGPGRYLLTSSVEYQNHLYGNLDVAIFADAGNAMNHWGDKLNFGRGVGLIYHSFIGPIKFYAGQGMSRRRHPWTFELSIGPEF